ncbi:MAG: hypothetical protein GY810_18860, partial [Aureispira sp.]|nr:hypothetical protein [Aureispira sp.]
NWRVSLPKTFNSGVRPKTLCGQQWTRQIQHSIRRENKAFRVRCTRDQLLWPKKKLIYAQGTKQVGTPYTGFVISNKYPNIEIQEYLDGKKHGLWAYLEASQLQKIGYYQRDLKHGTWLEYNPDGSILAFRQYKFGKPHGAHKTWSLNNELRTNINYSNGKKKGFLIVYNPIDSTKHQIYFLDDLKNGPEFHWYANGQLASRYQYTNGTLSDTAYSWFEKGQLREQYI